MEWGRDSVSWIYNIDLMIVFIGLENITVVYLLTPFNKSFIYQHVNGVVCSKDNKTKTLSTSKKTLS